MKIVLFALALVLVLAGCGSSPCAEALADIQEMAKGVEMEFDRATEIRRENMDTYCTVVVHPVGVHGPIKLHPNAFGPRRLFALAYTVRTDTVGELVVEITKLKFDLDSDGDLEGEQWRDI